MSNVTVFLVALFVAVWGQVEDNLRVKSDGYREVLNYINHIALMEL